MTFLYQAIDIYNIKEIEAAFQSYMQDAYKNVKRLHESGEIRLPGGILPPIEKIFREDYAVFLDHLQNPKTDP